MSLTMMALRICAVQALKSADTLVGDNVLDSQISAIDQTADGTLSINQAKPFIAVYTDNARSSQLGTTGLRSNGLIDLVFNCGVSVSMAETNKLTGKIEFVEGFTATDAKFEALLDVLDVQITRALVDPDNEWAQCFGAFVNSYETLAHDRSSSSVDNVRLAAGQTKITLNAFADPVAGAVMANDGKWSTFLNLLEAGGMPEHALFSQYLGVPNVGLYEPFEKLTSMTTEVAKSLLLYDHAGIGRSVSITDPVSDAIPT